MAINNFYKLILILLFSTRFSGISMAQLNVGDLAPPIVLEGISGSDVNLSDFKGKVVLIDFWASWCAPCRKSNPKLEQLYQKYKSYDFVVVGISLDSKYTSWLTAIKKDKLTYPQMIDIKNWNSKVVEAYGVETLPASFLISKDEQIIAINPSLEQIEQVLKQ